MIHIHIPATPMFDPVDRNSTNCSISCLPLCVFSVKDSISVCISCPYLIVLVPGLDNNGNSEEKTSNSSESEVSFDAAFKKDK